MKKKKLKKNTAQKRVRSNQGHSKQITAIILMAVAVFVLAIIFIPTSSLGSAGVWIKKFIFGIFGFSSYVLPIVLGYWAIAKAREKSKFSKTTCVFALLLVLFVNTAFETISHEINSGFFKYLGECFLDKSANFGGGIVGGILGYPLIYFLGSPLCNITVFILIAVSLMIVTGTTLSTIGVFAKKTGEKAQQIHNDTKEWIEKRVDEREENKQRKQAARFNVDVPLDDEPVVQNLERIDENPFVDEAEEEPKPEKKKAPIKAPEVVQATTVKPRETKKSSQKPVESTRKSQDYIFPPLELLSPTQNANSSLVDAELKSNSELLVNVLQSFGVEVRVTGYSRGPSVTRYEIQPAVGVKISKITGLADDIALQLRAANVRISAIPNKASIGIEVPNTNSSVVGMRDLIDTTEFKKSKAKLLVSLGKDVTGSTAYCDLSKMPHLLVAGTTGSGKSVCLNAMIMSILYKASPDEVKFVMIDPKAVEFPVYNGIPHLLVPVVTDPRKAAGALGWAVVEMEKRYKTLAENGVRNIIGYNELCKKNSELDPMPQIVIFIDEFADLMMVAGNEVESSVCRLAQKARAAGIHLVIATQRPSADIFTGLIKSNIPSRISLSVASSTDSRIIIDMQGAEKLLGKGDMLYLPIGASKPHRIQGSFISDDEVRVVTDYIKEHSEENEYDQSVICEIDRQAAEDDSPKSNTGDEDFGSYDAKINEAIEIVVDAGMASTSLLQRKLSLGYARAARIVDQMEEKGIVGPHKGSKPREVLISKQDWQQMQMQQGIPVNTAVTPPQPQQLSFDDEVEEYDDGDEFEVAEQEPLFDEEIEEVKVEEEIEDEVEEAVEEVEKEKDDNSLHLDDDDDDDFEYIDEDFLNKI